MLSILIMVAITVLEDVPQISLVLIYMATMKGIKNTGASDPVAVVSLIASFLSVLFSSGTVFTHVNKLREQNPTGWWRISVFESEEEITKPRNENASFRASFTRNGSSAAEMSNPMFAIGAGNDSSDYLEVQESLEETLEAQTSKSSSKKQEEEAFGGFENDVADLCESGQKTGKECSKAKAAKSTYCKSHTCTQKKCHRLKSRKADYCNQHAGTEL